MTSQFSYEPLSQEVLNEIEMLEDEYYEELVDELEEDDDDDFIPIITMEEDTHADNGAYYDDY